jgi:hypothetical protein
MIFPQKVLPNVTLITIAGVEINKALYALWRSKQRINFAEVLLVTDKVLKVNVPGIQVQSTNGFKLNSLDAYNEYCVYRMYHHIKTEYALVVQADGYVIHPNKWKDDFLKYDYVGAPWRLVETAYIDPFGNHQRVGNGGFSLRSRKLLETPLKAKVKWDVNRGTFYKHFNSMCQAEDGIICVHNRHIYEEAGNRFAPLEVALQFSCEQKVPEYGYDPTFGYHKHFPRIRERIIDYLFRFYFNWKYL